MAVRRYVSRKGLVDEVGRMMKKYDVPSTHVRKIVDCMFELIAMTLCNGGLVEITGFGTFRAKRYKAKRMRSHISGWITISAKNKVKFTTGRELLRMLNTSSPNPKEELICEMENCGKVRRGIRPPYCPDCMNEILGDASMKVRNRYGIDNT